MFPDPRRTAPVNTLDSGLVSVLSTGIHRSVGTPSALLHAVNMSEGLAFPSGADLQELSRKSIGPASLARWCRDAVLEVKPMLEAGLKPEQPANINSRFGKVPLTASGWRNYRVPAF